MSAKVSTQTSSFCVTQRGMRRRDSIDRVAGARSIECSPARAHFSEGLSGGDLSTCPISAHRGARGSRRAGVDRTTSGRWLQVASHSRRRAPLQRQSSTWNAIRVPSPPAQSGRQSSSGRRGLPDKRSFCTRMQSQPRTEESVFGIGRLGRRRPIRLEESSSEPLAQAVRIGSEHAPGLYQVHLVWADAPLTREQVLGSTESMLGRDTVSLTVVAP